MIHNYSDEQMSKTGVYKITCLNNNKIYIGSASCIKYSKSKIGFKGRLNRHLYKLRVNKHRNKILQNSYNKYGENAFTFEIIEYCEPLNCFIREQYWLDTLKPFDDTGFNICKTALTNNHIIRPKNRVYTRDNSKINTKLKIPIIQKDLNGNILQEFSGITEASRICGIQRMSISSCCRGINKTGGKYIWEYKYPENFIKKPKQQKFKVKVSNLETGNTYIYSTISGIIKELDYCKSTISLHLNNNTILENKYKFEKMFL